MKILNLVSGASSLWRLPGMQALAPMPDPSPMAQHLTCESLKSQRRDAHTHYVPLLKVGQCIDKMGVGYDPCTHSQEYFEPINEDLECSWYKKSRIIVRDKVHLQELCQWHIQQYGWGCDLNHLDVSALRDFEDLFAHSLFNGRVECWDMRRAYSTRRMFYKSAFSGSVSVWRMPRIKDIRQMFSGSMCRSNVSYWNIGVHCQMDKAFENSCMPVPHWYVEQSSSK